MTPAARFKLGVLATQARGWHARDLERAAPAAGVELRFLDLGRAGASLGDASACTGGVSFGLPAEMDALLVRSIPAGTLEQVVFRMDALWRLASSGLAVVNPPRAIECAVDKYLTLARISEAGLAVPRTRVAQTAERALADLEELGGDTVVKPLFGSAGRGIFRASEGELAGRAFRALERLGAAIYQQEFLPHPGGDLRVLVVGGEAVLAMRRRAGPAAEWRTNVARGGLAAAHSLAAAEAELAERAAAAVGAELAGVDLLPEREGRLLVTEVNSAPGWRALSRATGADVAALVLASLKRRAAR